MKEWNCSGADHDTLIDLVSWKLGLYYGVS